MILMKTGAGYPPLRYGRLAHRYVVTALLNLIFHIAGTHLAQVTQHLRQNPFERIITHLATCGPVGILYGNVTVIADVKSGTIAMATL